MCINRNELRLGRVTRSMVLAPDRSPLPVRKWRVNPKIAVSVGLICWLLAGAVAFLVTTGRATPLDAVGLLFWRSHPELVPAGPPLLIEMVRDLTSLGGVLLRNILALGAALALLFLRLRREAVLLMFIVAGGWLANTMLKAAVGRERPEIVPHLTSAGGASFPSGHSFNSAVIFIAIALAFATLSSRPAVRFTVIGAATSLSMAVAWSRVWLGVHFPSDVIAGWLGGVGWALIASAVLQRPAEVVSDMTEGLGEPQGGT